MRGFYVWVGLLSHARSLGHVCLLCPEVRLAAMIPAGMCLRVCLLLPCVSDAGRAQRAEASSSWFLSSACDQRTELLAASRGRGPRRGLLTEGLQLWRAGHGGGGGLCKVFAGEIWVSREMKLGNAAGLLPPLRGPLGVPRHLLPQLPGAWAVALGQCRAGARATSASRVRTLVGAGHTCGCLPHRGRSPWAEGGLRGRFISHHFVYTFPQ